VLYYVEVTKIYWIFCVTVITFRMHCLKITGRVCSVGSLCIAFNDVKKALEIIANAICHSKADQLRSFSI